jgi:hypothetical protein
MALNDGLYKRRKEVVGEGKINGEKRGKGNVGEGLGRGRGKRERSV